MTIVYDPARAAQLATSGQENNPVFLWQNLATVSNVSSTVGVVPGSSVTSAVTGSTYDRALFNVTLTSADLVVDLGTPRSVGCAAISAHNIGTLGATVRIEYSNDGTTWFDAGAGPDVPLDNQAIMFRWASSTHRYWRLFIGSVTPSDVPSIGVFVLGNETIMPTRVYQGYTPPITSTMSELQSNVSEGSNLLGSATVRKGSEASASFEYLSDTFVRSDEWRGFQAHFNDGGGTFWAWRPTKYDDLFYGWRSGSPIVPTNSGPKAYMSLDVGMRLYDQP